MAPAPVAVAGGGLAGTEAALALAHRGHDVRLYEMRPRVETPAHRTAVLGELVCTNSFKSELPESAHGQLKREMRCLGSALQDVADEIRVPAGAALAARGRNPDGIRGALHPRWTASLCVASCTNSAAIRAAKRLASPAQRPSRCSPEFIHGLLAVDRELFAAALQRRVEAHPRVEVVREELRELPSGPAVVATGPLTSGALAEAIAKELGDDGLAFHDAIAPIVHSDSVDCSVAFAAGRYDQAADYLNCPLDASGYNAFVRALQTADRYEGYDWEEIPYFEGCLPIEEMAERGHDTLRFGPMRPTGLRDPGTGRRPHAVVQLRREDRRGQMLNLVGFQTRLRTGEQRRVFGMIPGLADAEFLRFGSIHRNTFLNFPGRLAPYGATPQRPDIVFAGQLTGVEGYTESAASGILAAIVLDRILADGEPPPLPPSDTMLGALYRYLRQANPDNFQPMNSNWGLVDPMPDAPRRKLDRRRALAARADASFRRWAAGVRVASSGDRCLAAASSA